MDWHSLYFGRVSPQEVQEAVRDTAWQEFRRSLKGLSLEAKYELLSAYRRLKFDAIPEHLSHERRMIEVRLTNYVTALSRGGLIKPTDYR